VGQSGQLPIEADVEPAVSRGHPHAGQVGYRVVVNGKVRELHTAGAVLAELGRHVVDLDGKLEIEVERKVAG
jgi:hypothetical protein